MADPLASSGVAQLQQELIEQVRQVQRYVDRCMLYGPTDALREHLHLAGRCADDLEAALLAVDAPPPQAEEPWQDISTYSGHAYELLFSPAHSRVIGAHVTGDVWHLVGVGCVTNGSERPTHWRPLPAPPTVRPTRQEGSAP